MISRWIILKWLGMRKDTSPVHPVPNSTQITVDEVEDDPNVQETLTRRIDNVNVSSANRIVRIARDPKLKNFASVNRIALKKGQRRIYVYELDPELKAASLRISSNIVVNNGHYDTPEKYELFSRRDLPPSLRDFDKKSAVITAKVASKIFYSRNIDIWEPTSGRYYILLVALKSFSNLVLSVNVDLVDEERDSSSAPVSNGTKVPKQNTLQLPVMTF